MNKKEYILVQWPQSQEFMKESWFNDDAVLGNENDMRIGSAAYFIPKERYNETIIKWEILSFMDWLGGMPQLEHFLQNKKKNEEIYNNFNLENYDDITGINRNNE